MPLDLVRIKRGRSLCVQKMKSLNCTLKYHNLSVTCKIYLFPLSQRSGQIRVLSLKVPIGHVFHCSLVYCRKVQAIFHTVNQCMGHITPYFAKQTLFLTSMLRWRLQSCAKGRLKKNIAVSIALQCSMDNLLTNLYDFLYQNTFIRLI